MNNSHLFNTGETQQDLRSKYNPEGSQLRKMQLRMLDMLLYIDKVCKEQNIEWRLDGGNILGAVRHGGFIPWDDDIDIVLLPKEFKKLVKYLEKNPHPQFVLQTNKTDHGFYAPNWAVLRDLKSEYFQDSFLHNARKFRGAQIDIFCYDNHLNKKLYSFIARFTRKNIVSFIGRKPIIAKLIYEFETKILIPLFKIVGRPFSDSNLYGHAYGHLAYPFYFKWVSSEMVFPHKPILFEGHFFPGPGNPEKFLRHKYGNYMDLPAIDQRNPHQAEYKIWD